MAMFPSCLRSTALPATMLALAFGLAIRTTSGQTDPAQATEPAQAQQQQEDAAAGNAADGNAAPSNESTPAKPELSREAALALKQSSVADKYARLEKLMFDLSALEADENPRRAALLRQAVKQSTENLTKRQLDAIAEQLGRSDFSRAATEQEAVLKDLGALLDLLLSEDRPDRLKDEQERIRQYIKELDRIIRLQGSVQGRTEGGVDPQQLSREQEKVADRARALAQEIQTNEESTAGDKNADAEEENDENPTGENKPGENADGESKPGESKPGESKPGESKPGESKPGESKPGESKPGEDEPGEDQEDKADESESGDKEPNEGQPEQDDPSTEPEDKQPGKSGEPTEPSEQEGKPQEGESGDGQSQDSDSKSQQQQQQQQQQQGQQSQSGQQQEGGDSEQQQQEQQQDTGNPARKRIQAAEERMREAQRRLEEAKREESLEKQEEAREELMKAKAELEEILRQMREEEVERMLSLLEGRFRKMLEAELKTYEATKRLDRTPEAERGRDFAILANNLSGDQRKIALEADRALLLLKEEGSSVAFPESVEQMRDEMNRVADRLAAVKTGLLTQEGEEEIIAALEEMIEALQKAQQEQQQRQQSQPGQPGQPGDPPLVDGLAELKMIRALQMRVNTRTQRFARLLADEEDPIGQAEDADLAEALRQLADREVKILKITRDLILEKNK